MNTINIFLKPTGSVAELEKDFPIYVGSYKTNYVKVYVLPTMMPVIENVNYGLALSGKFTLDNGSDFVAEPTWLEALPDETITSRNVETTYKVFGTYLPRKLCSYAGNQTLVLNLQSINSVTNEFISVITTQEANVLIQRSAYVLVDETPEPGQYEQINGRVTENEEDILDLQNDITDINTRIDNLPLSEDYIGSFSGTTQPFDDGVITDAMVALLNAEVADIKGESYVKKNGDVLIYTYQITGETDKNYKFIYTTNDTWTGYEIPALEVAGNGSLGIVEGTEGTGSTNDVIVDIGSGQIKNIKFKDNGNYVALGTIPTTYQTKAEGASKTYVREYSLPREFNDIYYLTNSGYQKEVPNTPSSGIQYTATSSSVGDTELFTCSFVNTADFELSAKNSTNNNVYIKATANATLQFRMTTQYRKNGEADWTDLSIELTGDIPFVANQLQKVQFGSAMTELGDDMVTMTNGDQLRQILEVITETSDTISFEIYSNSTYPSIFNLNTQLATLVIGNLLERMEGSEYVSVAENESNTKIEFKIPDNKVETSAPQDGSSKLITSGAVYNAIPQIDEVSITENASNKIQASKLKEKDVKIGENSVNKADFNGVVELSEAQYQELLANGTITVDGQTITFDETAYYNTPDDGGTTQVYTKAETNALLDEKVDKKPDGTHDLIDSNNKITETYLPDYLLGQLMYGGTFNASTGVATLSDNAKAKLGVVDNTILLTNDTAATTGYTANEGIFYVTQTAGTFASQSFVVGDWLLSNGSAWEKIANADAVTGVKGNAEENYRLGQVNLTPANIGSYSKDEDDALLAGKLNKVITSDSYERVYAVDELGTQEMKNLEAGTGTSAPTHNTIPLRAGGGVVDVGTPTQPYHAANKYYVDTYGGKIDNIYVNNAQQTVTNRAVYLSVPTTTNDLTNNSGFITNAVSNLYNYYLKSETYSKSEVNNLISGITAGINLEVVAVLPTASEDTYFNTSKTIYLLAVEGSENNYYDEYITLRSGTEGSYTYSWEVIGSTQVDLSNYVQKTFTIAGVDLQDNITKSELANALGISPDLNIENGTGSGSVKLKNNTATGTYSTALGQNNVVQADRSFSNGGGNVIRYDSSNPSSVNGYMGFASGQNNYVSGWGAAAIGSQLEAKNSGQFITGSANKYKTDTYFEVGNGTISFVNVDTKPIWNDVVNNPIYYTASGDGYRKITENTMTLDEYELLTASDIYVFDDTKRSNAFEIKRDGSVSLGTNADRVVEDFKTYGIAYVINQLAPAYSISTLMAMGYDTLKTNYGDQVVQALSYQFQQEFTSCDEAIAYLINYTLGITYDDNEIKAPLSAAFGLKNVIYSLAAIVNGYNNKVGKSDAPQKGTASGIIGVNNEVYGDNDLIVGDTNKIEDATRSVTFGNNNLIKNSQGFDIHDAYGFGQGLKVEETHQTTVGRYNDSTVGATGKLFVVGNGSADNNRSNAFEVLENGVVRASGTPTGNNDLTTKSYVDGKFVFGITRLG